MSAASRKDFSGSLIWNMLVHGVTADSAHEAFPKPDTVRDCLMIVDILIVVCLLPGLANQF